MLLSIIIPTYNRKKLIGYTIDSLNSVFHPAVDLEIIVVDDHSEDGTEEWIRSAYPSVVLLQNEKKGASAARNTGLKYANGKYITYLDSDDLIGPGYFFDKIAYLESHPAVDACYGKYEFFASEGAFSEESIVFAHKYPVIAAADRGGDHLINYLSGNYLPQNATVWRKAFLLRINGHNEALLVNQDVELMIRSIFNGVQTVGLTDPTFVYVRNHGLDSRVGVVNKSSEKMRQLLDMRKQIYADLANYGFDGEKYYKTLSMFLFENWRFARHFDEKIAKEFLILAKKIYWPVQLNGTAVLRLLSNVLGPVMAVKIKYFLLKRD